MHYDPHFDRTGLCQCACEECAPGLGRGCICKDCVCVKRDIRPFDDVSRGEFTPEENL